MDGRRPALGAGAQTGAVAVLALVLILCECLALYAPSTWIRRDGRFYTNVNVTLVESGSLEQDEFCASWYEGRLGWNRDLDAAWSNIALGRDGEHLPKHPVLMPILSTPIFWAFGLVGTLIFNAFCVWIAMLGCYGFVRRFHGGAASACASLALFFGTLGVRHHVYDYHVDVLLLAVFAHAAWMAHSRRGLLAGILIGAGVMLRPTVLLWVPALVLLLVELRDWRTLKRALVGGAAMLVLIALSNHVIYGAPWWSSYNRVLVVVAGEAQLADHSGAFGIPLEEGLRTLWGGPWGAGLRLTLIWVSAPGLLLLGRRRPLYAISTALTLLASVLVFAKYTWYQDRFLFLSCVLMLPAVAEVFEVLARLWKKRPALRAPTIGAVAVSVIVCANTIGTDRIANLTPNGSTGYFVMHLAAAAGLGFGMTLAAQRIARTWIAAAVPLVVVLAPGVLDRIAAGGPDLYVACFVCLALGLPRWYLALGCSVFAGFYALLTFDSIPLSVLVAQLDEPALRPMIVLLVGAAISLPVIGRRGWLLAPLGLLVFPMVSGLGGGRWPLFAMALLALPLPALGCALGRASVVVWSRLGTRGRALSPVIALGALALIGVVRQAEQPFRIATYEGVRTAVVHLGPIPCDFLAWEHLNWECATYDRGVHGEVGLATSSPLHVRGRDHHLFLVTTQRGMRRTVLWQGIEAGNAFRLRYAVPDELRGGGELALSINGDVVTTIALPSAPDGQLRARVLDTSMWAGEAVDLSLTLSGRDVAVVLDGEFEP